MTAAALAHRALLKDSAQVLEAIRGHPRLLEALGFYKGSLSYEVNSFLRGIPIKHHVTHQFLRSLAATLSRLIRMTHRSPGAPNVTLYRSVFGAFARELKERDLEKQVSFTDRGFTSWSYMKKHPLDLIHTDDDDIVLFRMQLPPGTPFLYVDAARPSDPKNLTSNWLSQAEVILDAGMSFAITGRRLSKHRLALYDKHAGKDSKAGKKECIYKDVVVMDVTLLGF